MAVSKSQKAATARFEAKAYDKTLIRMPKGHIDVVKEHATGRGESLNGFIVRAIDETMQRDISAPNQSEGSSPTPEATNKEE